MSSLRPKTRHMGFTMVELLLALALGVLVAATLAALIRGLLAGGEGQAARFQGPVAARAAMRDLSRDIACAFAPPIENLAPLTLKPVSDDGKSGVELSFFVSTVMADSFMGLGYDIEQVTYRLARGVDGRSEILRISAPCSGPATNAPVTNRLLAGRFDLQIEAVDARGAHSDWPLKTAEKAELPGSLRLALALPGENPIQAEVLVQAATGIRSPVERPTAPPAEN